MSIWRVLSVLFPVLVCALGTMSVSGQELPPREGEEALLMVPPGAGGAPPDPAVAAAFAGAADAYGANDFAAARAVWRALADDGFGPAQYNLGVMLEHGRGGGVDYAGAAHWYARAADQDIAQAMINLARLHFEGRGVKRDPAEALHRLEMAAMLDAPAAAYNLGVARLKGLGGKADPAEAARWFTRAADAGHMLAAYNLGVLYRDGSGVSRDRTRAGELFAAAAGAGDAFAHYALADLLLDRTGAGGAKGIDNKALTDAVRHLDAAARAGVTAAQNRLAIMLAKGQGAKRDPETALMWFHVAAGLGAANAARNRDALARTLSQATRARAKRRADAFRPAVTKP